MKVIKVTIKPDGKTTIEVNGVKGGGCTSLTEGLQKKLGLTVSSEKTNEYYEQEEEKERLSQG
jgi:uridine kinase